MKWTCPKRGDERIIKKFLWFPRTIGTEKRWFEIAQIKQKYDFVSLAKTMKTWKDVEWL